MRDKYITRKEPLNFKEKTGEEKPLRKRQMVRKVGKTKERELIFLRFI